MVIIRGVNKAHSLSHPIWQITVTARANKEHRKAACVCKREREREDCIIFIFTIFVHSLNDTRAKCHSILRRTLYMSLRGHSQPAPQAGSTVVQLVDPTHPHANQKDPVTEKNQCLVLDCR